MTNSGGTPTGLLSTSLSGSDEFQVAVDNCNGTGLAANGSCDVQLVFVANAPGDTTGGVTVTGSPGESAAATLSGIGQSTLTIGPASTDFGAVAVGTSSAVQTVRVANPIGAPTTGVLQTALSGSEEFHVVSNACAGSTLAAAKCATCRSRSPVGRSAGQRRA